MKWVFTLLALVDDLWSWLRDRSQQAIGAQKQVIADDAKTIKVQKAELEAAVNRPDDQQLSDSLRNGKF